MPKALIIHLVSRPNTMFFLLFCEQTRRKCIISNSLQCKGVVALIHTLKNKKPACMTQWALQYHIHSQTCLLVCTTQSLGTFIIKIKNIMVGKMGLRDGTIHR